jgi:periplasmic protein TonB
MFTVLTRPRRHDAISPATLAVSLAGHLLVLGGVLHASGGTRAPAAEPRVIVDILWELGREPPPPQPRPAPPTPPDPDGILPAPGDRVELSAPHEVPEGIVPEEPGTEPVDPAAYGDGRVTGDVVGTPPVEPMDPTGSTGAGDPETFEPVVPLEMVERRPSLERSGLDRLLERHYPGLLRHARIGGRVLLELVVDADGGVRPGSARIVDATHAAFGEATLRVAGSFRFSPARVNGVPVAVRVTLPVRWEPPR